MSVLGGKIMQGLDNLVAHKGIESSGGFVENQKFCLMRKSQRKCQFHLLTAGHDVELFFHRQFEVLHKTLVNLVVPVDVGGLEHTLHLRKLQHRKTSFIEDHTDSLLHRRKMIVVTHFASKHGNRTPVDFARTHHCTDQSGLSGTVLADKSDNLSFGHHKRNVFQSEILVPLRDILQFNCIHKTSPVSLFL